MYECKRASSASLFFCRDLTILVLGLASPHANVPPKWISPDIFWRGTVGTSWAMLDPRLFSHCTRIIMACSQTCFPVFLWRSSDAHNTGVYVFWVHSNFPKATEIISLKIAVTFPTFLPWQCTSLHREITVEGERENLQTNNNAVVYHCRTFTTKKLEKRGTPGHIAWLTLLFSSRAFAPFLPLCLRRLDWRNGTKTLTPCFNKWEMTNA